MSLPENRLIRSDDPRWAWGMYLWVLCSIRTAGPRFCMLGILSNKDSQAHVVFK